MSSVDKNDQHNLKLAQTFFNTNSIGKYVCAQVLSIAYSSFSIKLNSKYNRINLKKRTSLSQWQINIGDKHSKWVAWKSFFICVQERQIRKKNAFKDNDLLILHPLRTGSRRLLKELNVILVNWKSYVSVCDNRLQCILLGRATAHK